MWSVIEDRLAEWRRLLRQTAQTGRVVLDRVFNGRIAVRNPRQRERSGRRADCAT
jgi:hypothetical protein